ncbi:ATP-binding protein [Catenovulum sediminis]|uniref:histidine kinase n=1 Tax=Catenovulum sediminis TaxID=1740262 RepID=A0ABV1RNB4_9ALTE|nr:ATP-binding protein [Catenovulum sediminis]
MKLLLIIKKLNPLNSLFGRIFLGFWGTVLVVVAVTIFINQQLNDFNKVKPLDGYQEHHLLLAKKKLEKAGLEKLTYALRRIQKEGKLKWVVLKNLETGELLSHRKPRHLALKEFKQLAFEPKPLQVRLDDFLIAGPVDINIENTHFKLMLAYKLSPRADFYRALWHSPEWLKFLIAGLLTILPCWLIARSISKPIHKLNRSTHILAEGNLSHRVEENVVNRHDEIGKLANDFNEMANKLESNLELHKRLLGDVSHELRTPLTRLELSLAMAMKDPANSKNQLVRIEAELHKLDEMISSVLRLARLENEDIQLEKTEINLSILVKDIIQSAQVECDAKNIQLKTNIAPNIEYLGDALLLNSAFENILRNAIKFSETNSEIEVKLKIRDDEIIYAVCDNGPGVNSDELNKIFMPFYRVNKARDRKTGGTGLGLTIANKAVLRHCGRIEAHNKEPKGLQVNIYLPMIQLAN